MAKERALLVGLVLQNVPLHRVEEYLDELASLVDTAGGLVVRREVQSREHPDPATFVGRGKAEELGGLCATEGINLVVFDDDLTPAQVRNLEKAVGVRVTDRTGVILDIFARRARTREAKTQVELAQYTYLLPRLTRAWTHLSRQAGGIGTRGVGETQLETDRRVIRRRIAVLTCDLRRIADQREVQRRSREETFEVALVGYTNVGKSSLMNRLTAAHVTVEDRLFSTLDTTFRRMPSDRAGLPIVLIDTVGLVRKLPHHLVASFRSTLEQASEADLILHVVDVSHPSFEEQAVTTLEVLADLGMDDIPVLTVLNKLDCTGEGVLARAGSLYPDSVAVSATTGEGLSRLREAVSAAARRATAGRTLFVPYEAWPQFVTLRTGYRTLREHYENDGVTVVLRAGEEEVAELATRLGITAEAQET